MSGLQFVNMAWHRVHSSQAKVLVVVSADSCDHCMMTRSASRHVTWTLQTSHHSHETDATSHRITTSRRCDANYAAPARNHNFTWHTSSSATSGFGSAINNIWDRLHSPRTSRCLRDRNTLIPQPRLLRAEREAGHWPWAASHHGEETMGMFLLKLTWVWLI